MTWKTTSAGDVISSPLGRRRSSETRRHLLRFGVIGVTSVLIDLTVYSGLLALMVLPTPAKGVSYVAGMVFGFLGNKFWTFGSRRGSASEPVTYLLIYSITLAINMAVNAGVLQQSGSKWMAFVLATGVSTVLNFLGLRWVTFRVGIHEARPHPEREMS